MICALLMHKYALYIYVLYILYMWTVHVTLSSFGKMFVQSICNSWDTNAFNTRIFKHIC